jgi:gas vesicle protein
MTDRNAYITPVLCFLAGGLAGAGVALLMAPQSGEVAREAVRRKFRETDASARELKEKIVRRGEEVRVEAGRRVSAAASVLAGNGADAAV